MTSVVITGAAGNLGNEAIEPFRRARLRADAARRAPRRAVRDRRGRPVRARRGLGSARPRGERRHSPGRRGLALPRLGGAATRERRRPDQRAELLHGRRRPRRLVFASSLLTMDGYRNATGIIRPDMPPRPTSFYAVTKLVGERLCLDATRRGKLDVVCLRLGITRRGANAPTHKVGCMGAAKMAVERRFLPSARARRFCPEHRFHPGPDHVEEPGDALERGGGPQRDRL